MRFLTASVLAPSSSAAEFTSSHRPVFASCTSSPRPVARLGHPSAWEGGTYSTARCGVGGLHDHQGTGSGRCPFGVPLDSPKGGPSG